MGCAVGALDAGETRRDVEVDVDDRVTVPGPCACAREGKDKEPEGCAVSLTHKTLCDYNFCGFLWLFYNTRGKPAHTGTHSTHCTRPTPRTGACVAEAPGVPPLSTN